MKLASILLLAAAACSNAPSKLEGKVKPASGSGSAAISGELGERLKQIESRLEAIEKADLPGSGSASDSIATRIHRIEASLTRREESLAFLELAYQQQKQQMEAKEAEEQDPDAVFAVDIAAPIKAGQVEGPNSATVTVVEAWDFA